MQSIYAFMVLWCQWIILECLNYSYSKEDIQKFPWNTDNVTKVCKTLKFWVLKLCSVLSNKYFHKHFISKEVEDHF